MSCRSFPVSTRLCKEACAFFVYTSRNLVFTRIACCIYKQNKKKRSAGDDDDDDDEHETTKKVIKKGISRKWIVPTGDRKIPVG